MYCGFFRVLFSSRLMHLSQPREEKRLSDTPYSPFDLNQLYHVNIDLALSPKAYVGMLIYLARQTIASCPRELFLEPFIIFVG